jgi:uncharacterized protein with PQ loop repeat
VTENKNSCVRLRIAVGMLNYSTIQIVGTCGVVSSQLMNLSAIPSILEILSAGSCLSYPSFPIIIAITNAIHNILYAATRDNHYVILSSLMSLLLNTLFLFIHACFTKRLSTILRQFIYFPVISTLLSVAVITQFQSSKTCMPLLNFRDCLMIHSNLLGTISTSFSTMSYCGQLSTFRRVVRTKDSSSISPWMTAGVLLRASCWFVYSYLINDWFYLTSTSIGIMSACVQIILLTQYPRSVKLD